MWHSVTYGVQRISSLTESMSDRLVSGLESGTRAAETPMTHIMLDQTNLIIWTMLPIDVRHRRYPMLRGACYERFFP